ncbi:MAG TPA: NUDIX hydrolase [Candidatus Saccharimonadales bacterium]|nr:NUDIX hydrolase [Candidatus Saccharimonadales bacterium]
MAEEIVDIVGLDCSILSCVPKSEAHQKGLLHRTVIGEVRRPNGDWVLVKQSSDRQDAGQYVSPVGGHAKAGESNEDALAREALEEIGLTGLASEFVGRFVFERQVLGRHENHYFIVYRIITDQNLLLGDEAVSYETFSEENLRRLIAEKPDMFGEAFFALLRQFYPHLLTD